MMGHRHDNLVSYARWMRKDATPMERLLWARLRNRQLMGFKFRRQFLIGPFVADFCCSEKKLVIELDGSHHADRAVLDQKRTAWLGTQGYRVVRFSNTDIRKDIDVVLECISRALIDPDLPDDRPPHRVAE